MIAILKYPAGNIRSVINALRRIGIDPVLTDDTDTLRKASHVIIPGQGAADTTMRYLRERGLDKVILSLKQPVLGICIGMQLMCRWSEEGDVECLGIFDDAEVRRFPSGSGLKVPHMGWNQVNGKEYMYFVHSYRVQQSRYAVATTNYGGEFVSMLQRGNFLATQFHPEKSGEAGEQLLRDFLCTSSSEDGLSPDKHIDEPSWEGAIPAIDIIDGQCVRLTKGDYQQKTIYGEDPVEIARHFESLGAKRLHVVDLDGAKASHVVNIQTLKDIASKTSLRIDFGGGIKQREDLLKAFEAGAEMVTIGSIAASNPQEVLQWIKEFGAERFIIGADALNGKVMVRGWKEDSGLSLHEFIDKYMSCGVKQILCTDISRDGMLQGTNLSLYKEIMQRHPDCHLIASGGVSSIADLKAIRDAGIPAAVFGKAYYEGRIKDEELKSLFTC